MNGRSFERAIRQTELIITIREGKARVDTEEKKIIFPTGIHCDYLKEKCFSADLGHVFWKTVTPDCGKSDDYSIVFKGKAQRTIIQAPSLKFRICFIMKGMISN